MIDEALNALAANQRLREEGANNFPDFLTFRERHFAYKLRKSGRVVRATNSWFQRDATAKLESENRVVMILPPGHIKTTFFDIERNVYDIMANRDFRGLCIMHSAGEAEKVVAAIQERLDHEHYHYFAEQLVAQGEQPILCPLCAYDLAPFAPQKKETGNKWGASAFKVRGRTSGEKDDTFAGKGVGGQILGIRSDRITLDDVQDPMQAMFSQTDSEQMLRWVDSVILGRIFDDQQLVVLANFYAPGDFAHMLMDAHPEWPVITYPAVLEDGSPLCPEVWTPEGLAAKKAEVGEQTWHYTWMQEQSSFASQTFDPDALEAAKDPDWAIGSRHPKITHAWLGVDPAIVNFCAIIAWGLDVRTGTRFLIDIFNQRELRTYQAIQAKVLDFARAYAPKAAVIESTSQQGTLIDDPAFRNEMRSLGVSLIGYQTVTEMGARAEHDNFQVSTVGGLFDAGKVVLPYGGTRAQQEQVDAYCKQLSQWRPGVKKLTRDMVMATLFAESEAFPVANRGPVTSEKRASRAPGWAQARAHQRQQAWANRRAGV